MSSSFVRIANKELHSQSRQMQFDSKEAADQYRQEIMRHKDIIAHQEAKIAYLYAELTKRHTDLEAREKACALKEKKINAALTRFASIKTRLREAMAKTKPEGEYERLETGEYERLETGEYERLETGEYERLERRPDYREQKSEKYWIEKEAKEKKRAEEKNTANDKEIQQVQELSDSLQQAWQRIKELENRLESQVGNENKDSTQQQEKISDTEEFSQRNLPLGYTPTANQSDIYLRGEPISFKQEVHIQPIENKLENLSKNFSSVRHYLQEVNRTIRRPDFEQITKKEMAATKGRLSSPVKTKKRTRDVFFACEELQNFLDYDNL